MISRIDHSRSVPAYLPTPHQIREGCREIRRGWTPRERATRRSGARDAWRILVLPHPRFDPHRVNLM
jgi:hypothetical protein